MLGMHNGLLLGNLPDHIHVLENGWKEEFGEPIHQDLIQDLSPNHLMPSLSLMYKIKNVGGSILKQ
jgi:hypothetical protein